MSLDWFASSLDLLRLWWSSDARYFWRELVGLLLLWRVLIELRKEDLGKSYYDWVNGSTFFLTVPGLLADYSPLANTDCNFPDNLLVWLWWLLLASPRGPNPDAYVREWCCVRTPLLRDWSLLADCCFRTGVPNVYVWEAYASTL